MDENAFNDRKTGTIQAIETRFGNDIAFIPNPLPKELPLSAQTLGLLVDANGMLRELNGIGSLLPDASLLLRPLQRREALTSSSLEGTYATPVELLLLENEKEAPHSEDRSSWREVYSYDQALRYGWDAVSQNAQSFTLDLIKEMHRRLMIFSHGAKQVRGEFRDVPVWVGSARRYVPVPPNLLNKSLLEFESYLNSSHKDHGLVAAFLAHYQFEAIHPFRDGNGRIGRVLLALTVAKWCELHNPWLYLSPFFEQYKSEYIDYMFSVSTNGDWESWIQYCLRGTIEQATDSIERCRALRELLQTFMDEVGDKTRMATIIERLFRHTVFEISDVMEWCDVSRPTAQSDINKLENLKFVEALPGSSRPRMYVTPEIVRIAYQS